MSLYEADAREADRCTELLKRAGWPKANRSLVVREALRLLQEVLADKDDERVFRYFVERYARRLGAGPLRPQRHDVTAGASLADGNSEATVDDKSKPSRHRH